MANTGIPVNFGITMRPELNIPEFMNEGEHPSIQWITKANKLTSPEQVDFVNKQELRNPEH